MFQSCYFGLGYGTGSLVGGMASQAYGYQKMFVGGAGLICCGWAAVTVGRLLAREHVAVAREQVAAPEH